jgi:enamine deaminase RidA (YjgF/YER057c/UK114 family)
MRIESKLEAMGLELPPPLKPPPGIEFPFAWVRVRGNRAYLSGSVAVNPDGTLAEPLGKVGTDVSAQQANRAARGVALSHLASLKRALGDLDRVTAWLRVFAMVNVAPDFNQTPLATNGYSDLILELYGPGVGMHARSSIGMALPLGAPVLCEAEVEINS